jgi:hypothetical protein
VGTNITTSLESSRTWSAEKAREEVNALYTSIQEKTNQTISWYFFKKKWPSRVSRWCRAIAIFGTALGGLCPILQGTLTKPLFPAGIASGLTFSTAGYLFLALAAAALAVDKYGGFSTAWIRYVRAGLKLQDQLNVFQMEWQILCATNDLSTGGEVGAKVVALLTRLKEFVASVGALVDAETQEWMTEFQNALSLLEKAGASREGKKDEKKDAPGAGAGGAAAGGAGAAGAGAGAGGAGVAVPGGGVVPGPAAGGVADPANLAGKGAGEPAANP